MTLQPTPPLPPVITTPPEGVITRPAGDWSVVLDRPKLSAARLWEAVEAWPQLTRLGRLRLLDHPRLTDAMRLRLVDRMTLLAAQEDRLVAWDADTTTWRTRIPLEDAPGGVPLAPDAALTTVSVAALGVRLRHSGVGIGQDLELVRRLSPTACHAFLTIAATRWRADVFLDCLGVDPLPRALRDGAFGALADEVLAWQGATRRPWDAARGRGELIADRLQRQRQTLPTPPFQPATAPSSWAALSCAELDQVALQLAQQPQLSRDEVSQLLAYGAHEGLTVPTYSWGLLLRLFRHPAVTPADRQQWLRVHSAGAPRTASPSHRRDSYRRGGLLGELAGVDRQAVAEWPVRDQLRLLQLAGPSLELLRHWERSDPNWSPSASPLMEPPAPLRFLARAVWGRTPADAQAQARYQVDRLQRDRARASAGLEPEATAWHQDRELDLEDQLFARLLPHPAMARLAGPFLLTLWGADPEAARSWPAVKRAALFTYLRETDPLGQRTLRPFLSSPDQRTREAAVVLLTQLRQTSPGAPDAAAPAPPSARRAPLR